MKLRRLLIKHHGQIYEFLEYGLNTYGDGTLYINFIRKGTNDEHVCYEVAGQQKIENVKVLKENCRKGIEISYHTTGCINYKDVKLNRIYGEPTYNITRVFTFAVISIPDIARLDFIEGENTEEDNIFEIPDTISSRVNINLVIAPYGYYEKDMDNLVVAKISYFHVLDLIIILGGDLQIPENLKEYFVYYSPTIGIFDRQQTDKHSALIMFHQKANQSRGMIIYQPNRDGVWKIIHTVPMRIPPHISIAFDDQMYSAEKIEGESTVAVSKFRVKNKYGHNVKKVVQINEIELDSRLWNKAIHLEIENVKCECS